MDAMSTVKLLKNDVTPPGQLPDVVRLNPEAHGALQAAWKRDLVDGHLDPDDDIHEAVAQTLSLQFVVSRGSMPPSYDPVLLPFVKADGEGKYGLIDSMFAFSEFLRGRLSRPPTDEERRNLLAEAADRKDMTRVEGDILGSVNGLIAAAKTRSSVPEEQREIVMTSLHEEMSPQLFNLANVAMVDGHVPRIALPAKTASVRFNTEAMGDGPIQFGPKFSPHPAFVFHQENGRVRPMFDTDASAKAQAEKAQQNESATEVPDIAEPATTVSAQPNGRPQDEEAFSVADRVTTGPSRSDENSLNDRPAQPGLSDQQKFQLDMFVLQIRKQMGESSIRYLNEMLHAAVSIHD